MHVQSAQPAVVLAVESIGHLVPTTDFAGRVHSVFARACNVAVDDALLTLCAHGVGDGPATLRLARAAVHDLRDRFRAGEPVRCRSGWLRSRDVALPLMRARVWRPPAPGRLLPRARIEAHLQRAGARLALQRCVRGASVVDRQAAPVAAALADACRHLDRERAVQQTERLVGWGEGLTPAGDDFLIGLTAGLDALVCDEGQRRFAGQLAGALVALAPRTTAVAAHHLRLAAGGHFSEPLIGLRNAVCGVDDGRVVEAALDRALAVGATSGADTVSGLLAGLHAWLPASVGAEAA